jgi:hypothetical protein
VFMLLILLVSCVVFCLCFLGMGWGSMLPILLVFCVVWFFLFFLGVYFDHLLSFLCCVFVFVFGGSILLILLVFCAFRFLGGGWGLCWTSC